ncbi:MAG: hypothetical protein KF817_08180 [Phycisphaeraceae bacterium]|nr:hypothetical protein [Phycisphaeraceae bacterium]
MTRAHVRTTSSVRNATCLRRRGRPWSLALMASLLVTIAGVRAGDFDLAWHTIDGGGGSSAGGVPGGVFSLSGSIGQPDAGAMSGGGFTLAGGFWASAGASPDDPPPCPGDLTGSGSVGVPDLLALLASWGPCPAPCPADLTGDGSVGLPDLLALLAGWGACP